MEKEVFKGLRLSRTLNDQIMAAAERRGMNWSEMVRHILINYFFNGATNQEKEEVDGR